MKVFVVIGNGWTGLVGVFSSREAAEKACKNAERCAGCEGSYESFCIKEMEVQ